MENYFSLYLISYKVVVTDYKSATSGFSNLNIDQIFAIVDPKNVNSKKVLSKLCFEFQETFDYEGDPTDWFELKKTTWEHKK